MVPTVPHLVDTISIERQRWPVHPRIVVDAADKQAAFRIARAALAKSGTVTLELALAGVPMVAAYRLSWLESVVGTAFDKDPVRRSWPIWSSVRTPCRNSSRRVAPPKSLLRPWCRCSTISPQRRARSRRFHASMRSWRSDRSAPATRAADIVLDTAPSRRLRRAESGRSRSGRSHLLRARSARNRAAWRRYRAGAAGRSSGADPRSFPSTGRSSRPCAQPQTAP